MDISNMAHAAADKLGWTEPGTAERTDIMKAFKMGFEAGMSEETARKIWDAAYNLGRMDYDEKDFKNFYKALIEGK